MGGFIGKFFDRLAVSFDFTKALRRKTLFFKSSKITKKNFSKKGTRTIGH